MAKYGKKAQDEVEQAMHEHKHQGRYKNKKQAVAVGLSKARREGGKVPPSKDD
ncbi:MAG TPA: DUF6496 domain-containing protein [Candidatus Saccharimonadales bacterium]|nr:DUF6496 domain-containing protein [Candidatus Saccharimonadales bacterium]